MFKTITDTIPSDRDYPIRQRTIDLRRRVLNGTIYDHLPNGFHEEKGRNDEYIPLRSRRPSVRSSLAKTVVDDSVSLLFSEGHFPVAECAHEETRAALAAIVKETKLNEVMIDAATRGSVGSVAFLLRVLKNRSGKNRLFFKVLDTEYLTPHWFANEPDALQSVVERYKVKGKLLRVMGYAVEDADLAADFWFMREWTDSAENWYVPYKVASPADGAGDDPQLRIDEGAGRTTRHDLGFVPIVWVKNLPGGDDIDGACTFKEAIDTIIEIDYLLSQGGRALKYASDPTLLIKEPAVGNDGQLVKGAANAIVVDKDGDAKLLEIDGTASEALLGFVKALRDLALESIHGNRANPDKIAMAQSGRAIELLNQALIGLADRLRISYGEGALLALLRMVVAVSRKFDLFVGGKAIGKLDDSCPIALRWPAWYAPTQGEKAQLAATLKTHADAGHMSRETAVKTIAPIYDIEDTASEIAAIAHDRRDQPISSE
ncbi:MAG TPA: phage portal protein, partial [Alphaproteobacteria bacterium]|nr:phage portal protein [Alphaproteobacteria bacterium]